MSNTKSTKKVTIILENAPLQYTSKKSNLTLLNGLDHEKKIVNNFKRDPQLIKPELVHQLLLTLIESPLNQQNHLQIFIRTMWNVLIYVHPQTYIPKKY